MPRRVLVLAATLLAVLSGCFKSNTRRDAIRPVPSDRGAGVAAPQLPSPVAKPADLPPTDVPPPTPRAMAPTADSSVPVVRLPSAEPAAAPPLLAPPADAAAADDRKPIRDRIKDRRDGQKPTPTMPSPIAPVPSPAPAAGDSSATPADARAIARRAADRFAALPDYEARLVRREVIGGKQGPTEEVLYQFRKQPFSIHMRNIGDAGRGREVVYVQGKYDGKMHIVIGEGDGGLFAKAGSKMAFDPDSPLVAGRSRRRITEAGAGNTLAKLNRAIEAGRAKALGRVTRKEYPYPLDGIEVTVRPGDDPGLPGGGKQLLFFDPNPESAGYALPVLVISYEAGDREVEYYCFDRYRAPARLTDADFDPDLLGKKK